MRLQPFIEHIQEGVRGGVRNMGGIVPPGFVIPQNPIQLTRRGPDDRTIKVFTCGFDSPSDPDIVVGGLREV